MRIDHVHTAETHGASSRLIALNSSSGIAALSLLVAVLLAIIVAGSGGMFIYMNQRSQTEELENIPMETNRPTPVVVLESTAAVSSTALVTPTPSAELPPTAQPKSTTVYTNVRYGFKMTLPSGWTAKEGNLAGGLDGSPPLPSVYDGKTATYTAFSPHTKTVLHFSVSPVDVLNPRAPQVVFHGNTWLRSVVYGDIWYHIVPPFAPHVGYLFETTSDQEEVIKQLLSTFEFIR